MNIFKSQHVAARESSGGRTKFNGKTVNPKGCQGGHK